MAKADWSIEIERTNGKIEYYAIDFLVVDKNRISIKSPEGPVMDFDGDSIRKVLVMRARKSKDAS